MREEDLYCKVFVDAPIEREALRSWIARKIDGREYDFDTVESAVLSLNVRRNDDAKSRGGGDPESFLYHRYFLDVEPASSVDCAAYVRELGDLLTALWAEGWQAVAAADFEDELPYSGGYRDGRLTFPTT